MSDLHCDGINDTAMVTATNTPSSSLPSSPSPSSSTPQHPHPAKKRLLSFPHPTTPDTNYNSDNSNNLCTNIILTNTPTNTMANSNHANTISDLPIELAFLILAYLPYRSLVSLSLVDRYWRHLTFHNDSILWYNLASKHGFLPRSPLLSPPLPSEPSSSSTPTSTLTTISTTLTASLRRWSLVDALAKRPGLNRALSQSRNRLLPIDPSSTSSSNSPSNRNTIATTLRPSSPLSTQKTSITTKTAPKAAAQTLCARLERGEVATWRDYFEASLILRREWINGKPVTKELRGHDAAVICVKVLPGRDRVVTGDRLGFLKVWCAVTGVCLKTYKRHMMGISSLSIQGDLLVSGSWDSTVVVWKQLQEAPYLKRVKVIDLGEQVMSMDLDSNLDLAIGTVGGLVMIISIETLSCLHTFQSPHPHLCTAVSLGPNKVEAAIGLNYYAWDRTTTAQVGFFADPHLKNITCMKVDTNERVLLTGSQDSKVRMFSWEAKPMLLRQYGGHRDGVRCITLQDDMIITGSTDKTAMVTFRGRHDFCRADLTSHDALVGKEASFSDVSERVPESVSLPHSASVNAIDSDVSMVVTGDDEGVVRIFDFGFDLWRPAVPSSPRLCGQASLISSASPTCVLMAKPGRSNVSIGNRRQTWGTSALAVLVRVKSILNGSVGQEPDSNISSAWMNVDEIYQRMVDWDLLPVR
ncbi:WD40-repeat-containing domain protein [Linnemannia elongata]|nr:WD40-repeat-containing domain protein [Linnemannia elongata]